MASEVDICNIALAHIGELPNVSSINPPEGSAHAEKCKTFYPMARDVALEHRNWSFALRRVTLAALTNDSQQWRYKYALPSDCLRPIELSQADIDDSLSPYLEGLTDYVVEGRAIYTNVPLATLRYLRRTTDTNLFPPTFVNAVSWLLASYLAGAITRDVKIKQWAYEVFLQELGTSAQSVANGNQTTHAHTASWISKR